MTPRLDSQDAREADITLYRESSWLRVRFALWRSLAILGLIYVGNVLINAIQVVIGSGIAELSNMGTLYRVFWLDEISQLVARTPPLAFSVIGIFIVSVLLSLSARVRYLMRQYFYRRDVQRYQRERIAEFRKIRPDAVIDETDAAWVKEIMAADAQDRQVKLQQIRDWFKYDDLLIEWTEHQIRVRRFFPTLLASAAAAAAAVIAARIILLFR
jgi:hypothetical protein